MKIKFRYKDQFTHGDWSYQKCDVPDIHECIRIYGLGSNTEAYEILEVNNELTREGKLKYLNDLQCDPRVDYNSFWYDEDILQMGRDDSLWYGGPVLCFNIKDENGDPIYTYTCRATGEVRLSIGEDDVVEQNDCAQRVVEFLEEHDIMDDRDMMDREWETEDEDRKLYVGNNNWFADEIYDSKKKAWVTDIICCDISDGPFSGSASETVDYLIEIIKSYREREESKHEE